MPRSESRDEIEYIVQEGVATPAIIVRMTRTIAGLGRRPYVTGPNKPCAEAMLSRAAHFPRHRIAGAVELTHS